MGKRGSIILRVEKDSARILVGFSVEVGVSVFEYLNLKSGNCETSIYSY